MKPQSGTRWSAPLPLPFIHPVTLEMLAAAILAADPHADAIAARIAETFGHDWRWARPLARRYLAEYANQTRPQSKAVVAFLEQDEGFRRACERHKRKIRIAHWLVGEPSMQPVAKAAQWAIPSITTTEDLAAWLRLSPSELEWFADLKTLGHKRQTSQKLQHYHYQLVTKPSGDIRLIESPKDLLKRHQRQILTEILNAVPPHPAAHGFVQGRSIKTFAAPHAGQGIVLRLDLKDFFPSIRRARVQSIFRTLGYPEIVANLLGSLCTNVTPRAVLRDSPQELRALYKQSHLPQGAPTSPALANICAYRLDCRLAGLAQAAGAAYTRYADDLAFSGTGAFERGTERFATHVAAIALEEGFAINHRKTRIMHRGVSQHLAGLVVNQTVNVKRADFDRLKAILTNCTRNGPAAENRHNLSHFREHLQGRIAFMAMIQPTRAAKLTTLFNAIDWT